MLALLERTGYGLASNERVQKMVTEDYAVEFTPGDARGNVQRIALQMRRLHAAALAFIDGRAPFTAVEAMGPGRRS